MLKTIATGVIVTVSSAGIIAAIKLLFTKYKEAADFDKSFVHFVICAISSTSSITAATAFDFGLFIDVALLLFGFFIFYILLHCVRKLLTLAANTQDTLDAYDLYVKQHENGDILK